VSGPAEPDPSACGDIVAEKAILAPGAREKLLRACGIDAALPDGKPDPGLPLQPKPAREPTTSSALSPTIGSSREKPIRHARVRMRGCGGNLPN
jgi:hypothetical protein